MRHPLTRILTKTACLLVLGVGSAWAQENLPFGPSNYEHDFQMFAPFDLDLDNMADDQWSGYFFEYNKLVWSYSGERVTIGNEDVTHTINWRDPLTGLVAPLPVVEGRYAEVIYRFNPQDVDATSGDIVTLPPPNVIRNTISHAPPNAGFALGNRYELGYQDQGHGWLLGVLDGPDLYQSEFYGFVPVPALGNGIPPFIDDDFTDASDIGPGGGETAAPGSRAFGFGSVPIIFDTPPGFLLGFRDYMNNFSDAMLGTQGGPYRYIGNYGASADPDTLPIPFFHLADDLDGDGIFGAAPLIVAGPDGALIFLGYIHDFDDLHEFNIYFDSITVRNRTESNGVELMWTHNLTNRHYMAKHQNNRLTISGGARFLRLQDQFRVDAFGSILHDGFWDTTFTNQIVGPQVALKWENQRQRWRLSADSRFLFGYNIADWEQFGLMGSGLIPGALNQPLYARPTAFSHGRQIENFSPVGELRLQASYHVTKAAALKFGYTGSYLGNIKRAAPSVHYRLPDMGYRDAGGQTLVVNGFDFGVEFVY